MFSAMDVTNQGQNTYSKFTNLTLEQGKTYYVWVMGEYLIVPEWIRSFKYNILFCRTVNGYFYLI